MNQNDRGWQHLPNNLVQAIVLQNIQPANAEAVPDVAGPPLPHLLGANVLEGAVPINIDVENDVVAMIAVPPPPQPMWSDLIDHIQNIGNGKSF